MQQQQKTNEGKIRPTAPEKTKELPSPNYVMEAKAQEKRTSTHHLLSDA